MPALPLNLVIGKYRIEKRVGAGGMGEVYRATDLQTKTPVAVIGQLNKEVAGVLAKAEVAERLARVGAEATSSTPERFGAIVRDDIARWGKVIRDAGIRAE